jgi:hypothetical protein
MYMKNDPGQSEGKPTAEDWMKIGNDLRIVLNDLNRVSGLSILPLLEFPTREPTEEELNEWEEKFPGSKQMFICEAYKQMRHRQSMYI